MHGGASVLGQAIITFREVLEAALIASITLAFLLRTGRRDLQRHLWWGILIAIASSLAVGASIVVAVGDMDEAAMTLFEGAAALLAVAVLTSMVLWMALKGPRMREEVQRKAARAVARNTTLGLVAFGFVIVFREGLETVLFLTPLGSEDPSGTVVGAVVGGLAAVAISFAIFRMGARIDLKRFFYMTSVLLVLLAGGLAGYGVHELIEHQEEVGSDVGWFGSTAFDLGVPSDSALHHKGAVGSVFAVMFGYAVTMEWGRVLVHVAYLAAMLPLTALAYRHPELLESVARTTRRWLWPWPSGSHVSRDGTNQDR